MYIPPLSPEQDEDHEFTDEVIDLVRRAARPGDFRRTNLETTWYEPVPTELPIGRPIRTEGEPPRRVTRVAVDALVFEVPETSVDSVVLDLAPQLQERRYTVYGAIEGLSELAPPDYERKWTRPSRQGMSFLTVVQARDPYEPLRIEGAGTADILFEDILRALKEWKRFSSFEIAAAHPRELYLAFRDLPHDLETFARAVYKLVPEAVYAYYLGERIEGWEDIDYIRAMDEQTPRDLARHLRKTKRLRLYWDR